MEGSARRLRPKLMTILANIFGLMPVVWANRDRPAIFTIWKSFEVRRNERA